MTIALLSSKGGSGKTSMACCLALYWADKGRKVGLIDMEEEGATDYFRTTVQHPNIIDGQTDEPHDITLIDTPAGATKDDLREFAQLADLCLVPCIPSAAADFAKTFQTIRDIGDTTGIRIVFNRVKPRTRVWGEREEIAAELGTRPLANFLCDRQPYAYATSEGSSAFNWKCRGELADLAKEIESLIQ